ncbi:hypothetical protein BDV97DRAFT_177589 [Delphinella strobiligena]|nr:hypothetical protein BDV97DRAFT_177589 [Delphinella strobiligena]
MDSTMSSVESSMFLPDYESTPVFEYDNGLPQVRLRGQSPKSDETLSMELGRIAAEAARRSALKTNNINNNMRNTSTLSVDNYDSNTSQQVKSRKSLQPQGAERINSLRKEASIRRAMSGPQDLTVTSNLSVTGEMYPTRTGESGAYQRRTLSDMHAKANDESIASFISSDRTEDATTIITRNTRFPRSRQTSQTSQGSTTDNPLFRRFATQQGLAKTTIRDQTPQCHVPAANPTFTGNQTQQSFMLPDLPNITELVSGMRRDGTPIFSRSSKTRSRFTAPNHNNGNTETLTHVRVNSMPLPHEEKAIIASLQLMRDKVSQLEMERSENIKRMEEYQNQVLNLKSRVQMEEKLRRPDSALGSDDEESSSDKWRVERAELQSTVRTLSERLRRTERKATVSDLTIKTVAEERDNLIAQLGAAYYSAEELKDENEKLHAKLAKTRAQIIQASVRATTDLKPIKAPEHVTTTTDLKPVNVSEIVRATTDLKPVKASKVVRASAEPSPVKAPEIVKAEGTDITELTGLNDEELLGLRKVLENERRTSRKSSANVPEKSVRIQSPHTSDAVSYDEPKDLSQSSIDSNLLASLETSLIANSHRRSRTKSNEPRVPAHTPASLLASRPPRVSARASEVYEPHPASLETSLINNSPRRRRRAKSNEETISAQKAAAIHDREQMQSTQTSMANDSTQASMDSEPSQTTMTNAPQQQSKKLNDALNALRDSPSLISRSRHQQRAKSNEETSAFILPDITLHARTENVVSHDEVNCTACPSKSDERKPVPAPVPVSERDIDDTDATMRPSQPPAVALATVMKQLEDEVAHLKMKLASYEKLYNAHDPATQRRLRRRHRAKMDSIIEDIEHRSDQIYALYDVLEGQKQAAARAGVECMDEEQVEETLQSLGIDIEDLAERAAATLEDKKVRKRYSLEGITGSSSGSDY